MTSLASQRCEKAQLMADIEDLKKLHQQERIAKQELDKACQQAERSRQQAEKSKADLENARIAIAAAFSSIFHIKHNMEVAQKYVPKNGIGLCENTKTGIRSAALLEMSSVINFLKDNPTILNCDFSRLFTIVNDLNKLAKFHATERTNLVVKMPTEDMTSQYAQLLEKEKETLLKTANVAQSSRLIQQTPDSQKPIASLVAQSTIKTQVIASYQAQQKPPISNSKPFVTAQKPTTPSTPAKQISIGNSRVTAKKDTSESSHSTSPSSSHTLSTDSNHSGSTLAGSDEEISPPSTPNHKTVGTQINQLVKPNGLRKLTSAEIDLL